MIIIMKSNRVNLSLLFMFASKDYPFCKKVQLKQVTAEAGHRCLARGIWYLFTPTEGGGRNHKHYFSWHARPHSLSPHTWCTVSRSGTCKGWQYSGPQPNLLIPPNDTKTWCFGAEILSWMARQSMRRKHWLFKNKLAQRIDWFNATEN